MTVPSSPARRRAFTRGLPDRATLSPVRTALPRLALALALLGAAPPVAASATPGVPQGALTFGGIPRTYVVHTPPGAPTGLVINLHGAGSTGGDQERVTGFDAAADRHGFVVAYPDGIDFSWADGRGASVPDRQGVDDVGFLSELIGQLSAQYGIPPGRVFVTGMSAGGFMASRLACDRADLVAAAAPVAGTLGSAVPCAPSRPVSVLAVHGDADPVVPYGGGPMVGRGGPSDIVAAPAMAARWRAIDGCPPAVDGPPSDGGDGTSVQRSDAGGCAGGTAVDFVTVRGGGHTWPSGNFSLPAATVGATTRAFDASAAAADFFAAHGR
jgi:polyhydroxybutyrate depolymerase